MTRRLNAEAGAWVSLPAHGGSPSIQHEFEPDAVLAVDAALATGRPLLVRGEPGTGKSQLARAAAHDLGAVLLVKVVDARTEIEELFWRFDAVRRLADAQILGGAGVDRGEARAELAEERYLVPEPLWWGFDWSSANKQAETAAVVTPEVPEGWEDAGRPRVVLVDEIDKADESLPNALLAALGSGTFGVRGRADVSWDATDPPLIVVTTNEERPLPDAFLRRCLVLHLALPHDDEELRRWLVTRGERHVPKAEKRVLERAAELLVTDRTLVRQRGNNPPGQAEYLDLVTAVVELFEGEEERLARLEELRDFALWKHEPRERGSRDQP